MQVPRRLQQLLALPVLVFALCGAVFAQQGGQEEKPEPLTLRLYDVGDLLRDRQDYPLWTGGLPHDPAEGAALYSLPSTVVSGPSELVAAAQAAVRGTSDPKVALWKDECGPATIEFIYQGLLVTQTARGHERIEAFLDAVRKHRLGGPLVTVEARWVLVDEAKAGDFADAPKEITEDVLKKAEARVLYRGRIMGFDRQRVHLGSGEMSVYVADAEPAVIEGAVGADPVLGVGFSGALLEVRPVLAPGAAEVVLDLHSEITEVGRMREKPLPDFGQAGGTGRNMKVTIDFPEMALHRFRTTTRVPLGKPVLIGGMTAPDTAGKKVVYLVVTVSASK